MSNSTRASRRNKPTKPYDDFPLTAHPSGRWCKKHRGKQYYFGRIDDWQSALARYQREWPFIIDGRTPPPMDAGEGLTIQSLCNTFLTSKRSKLASGELSPDSFADYYKTCERIVDHFRHERCVDDLRSDDFRHFRSSLAERLGTVSLKNEINRTRIVFKFAFDEELIERPVRYGQSFARPSAKMLRKARNAAGRKDFSASELRLILLACDGGEVQTFNVDETSGKPLTETFAADPFLKAMVLLGINCGFGNTDVASLPQSAVDFELGWIEFPRPKTEIRRRVPLWSETVDAVKLAVTQRPAPKDDANADLCFLTIQGNRWVRVTPSQSKPDSFVTVNTLAQRFGKMLKRLGINGRRGFYALRHVFETIGGESRDQVAVNAIMGHVDNSMANAYRERISDERLIAVTDTVHEWLFGM